MSLISKQEEKQWQIARLICPKNETLWESLWDDNGNLKYIITSNRNRDYYILYKLDKKMILNNVGKAKTPMDIHRRYLKGGWV